MSLQAGFEQALNAAWQDRDFDQWQLHRAIYADWLEEQNHPLWRMARCPMRMYPCKVNTKGGPRVWMWRLWFDLPEQWDKPRPRWWVNQRVNANQLLGFPPFTLRCKGWEEDTHSLRFSVVFKPRSGTRTRTLIRYQMRGSETIVVARDINVHPDGFAAAFWTVRDGVLREVTPPEWRVRGNVNQGVLFQ